MRIINLIQKPQLRGAEIFACQLSEHLLNQGHEVIVVTIYPGNAELPFSGEIINLNRNSKQRFWDLKGWKIFSVIVNRFKPDIIQANAADTLKFSVSSKEFFRWDSKILFRNANKMGDFINSKWKLRLNLFYLSKVDYVISVSKECEVDFIKTFRFPKEKVETIQIGVEERMIGEPPNDLALIFKNHKVITHIGGFVPEKNHRDLIEVMGNTLKKFPNLKLLLIGEGRLKEDIKTLCKTKGLEQSVLFLGYRKDVLEILSASDAFVLPSLIEGLPGVILEAMYCETPVIANNVGGIKEIVINGKTGYLVEKGDVLDFTNKLNMVLEKPKEKNFLAENAKRMVDSEFNNMKISQRFFKLYDKLSY